LALRALSLSSVSKADRRNGHGRLWRAYFLALSQLEGKESRKGPYFPRGVRKGPETLEKLAKIF
jgi:hypothetical protein